MPYSTLLLDRENEIAVVTLNRPEKRNAISSGMIDDLEGALAAIESSEARVAILTGAGTVFCAGMDLEGLRGMASRSFEENLEDSRRMAVLYHRLYSFPKPVIAAVNGDAIAGGCGLATLCDFTLAAPQARFGYTEVRIGFLPALVSIFLVRQVGEKHARDLLLSGRLVNAEEAQRLGLVSEVVPSEALLARARELGQALLANSPASIETTKRLLLAYAEPELGRQLERAIEANARIRGGDDFREGVSAFLEKRKPNWTPK